MRPAGVASLRSSQRFNYRLSYYALAGEADPGAGTYDAPPRWQSHGPDSAEASRPVFSKRDLIVRIKLGDDKIPWLWR